MTSHTSPIKINLYFLPPLTKKHTIAAHFAKPWWQYPARENEASVKKKIEPFPCEAIIFMVDINYTFLWEFMCFGGRVHVARGVWFHSLGRQKKRNTRTKYWWNFAARCDSPLHRCDWVFLVHPCCRAFGGKKGKTPGRSQNARVISIVFVAYKAQWR